MADKKISQLTGATTPLAGTEELPLVQGGVTKKVAASNFLLPGDIGSTVQGQNTDTTGSSGSVKSNSTTGILQVTGPSDGTTRQMTTPDANFTAARIDAAQTFTGLQTFSNGAATGSASLNGQIVKGRQNYYQICDTRNIAAGVSDFTEVNVLEIDFGASAHSAVIVRILSTVHSPGQNNYRRVDNVFVTNNNGSITITSDASQGSPASETVNYSVSGNKVLFNIRKNSPTAQTQSNFTYFEIIGMNMVTSPIQESTFTVTIL
jgi:hypothetical protein